MEQAEFIQMLDRNPVLKQDLFIRGFLVSSKKLTCSDDFPFYGNWRCEQHGNYFFYAHKLTGMHTYTDASGNTFFLLGHAYDPFTMEIDEAAVLQHIAEAFGTAEYMERIQNITGVYLYGNIIGDKLSYLVDPSGMQSCCSGVVNDYFYLSSHPQLVADLCGLKMDCFVKELTHYKWYGRVMGPYLPADLTPFTELKRVVPSICYNYNGKIHHMRFWPVKNLMPAVKQDDYDAVIREAAEILKKNMILVSQKWQHPWISLTGGIDSNTTLAAGNGLYDKFETFSYISANKELPDAAAAKKLAQRFGLTHHEYYIPDKNSKVFLFEEKRELFRHNNGYIAELYDNEARKKFFLRDEASCDVEVKSWVSETIRAYWYKHYGRKTMPKLSPKLYRNLYKIFISDRKLAHKIDSLFAQYLVDYEYYDIPASYPPADMHYNEVTWGSWGGLNISEMKYCFDITFIYNNRRFFDLLFRVPLEKRISDQHHLDMKRYLNSELADMNIRVINKQETKLRAFLLNVIFTLNSMLPF